MAAPAAAHGGTAAMGVHVWISESAGPARLAMSAWRMPIWPGVPEHATAGAGTRIGPAAVAGMSISEATGHASLVRDGAS